MSNHHESAARDSVLGISCDFHDSAAAVIVEGRVVAAAAEERFTRIKHDSSLPANAVRWCLEDADIDARRLRAVAFYEKPLTAYERTLVTSARVGPRSLPALTDAIGEWSKRRLWIGLRIERMLANLGITDVDMHFVEHHQSHAGAAFYPSPFESAAILTVDGVGEWATATMSAGEGTTIRPLLGMDFPDSLGLLYSTITAQCGFAVNDGEYKLMGLAPYGSPRFADVLETEVLTAHEDGSLTMYQRLFGYGSQHRMGSRRLDSLLGGPPRRPAEPLTPREADLAASIQLIIEHRLLAMARRAGEITGESNLVLAGGVALNCVANRALASSDLFDEVWVQPAAGDDGSALGAALWVWHQVFDEERSTDGLDSMSGCLLGPSFGTDEIAQWLTARGASFTRLNGTSETHEWTADQLASGKLVGYFRGRMEFGPRALGNRSILADPRDASNIERINLAVKGREGFRPFAPSVLAERAEDWFDVAGEMPYMTFTAAVRGFRDVDSARDRPSDFASRLATDRSPLAACTHVDGSARVQTVSADIHPDFHDLISAFDDRTGCPVLLNTSFNRSDEPIVRTPADALACFVGTDLDALVLEDCVLEKSGPGTKARPHAN